ncbi:MAG: chitobiase/beta-hexosaminidase C-terminal domain-containing protein [Chitinophagaceae bacterium]|nr:chitobiase/beta-hexosaminidase C-terminal domain-containing protein [Chitinophagaceae bacterium]
MHPLMVHFPIVLVILYALVHFLPLSKKSNDDPANYSMNDVLLFLAALSSVITSLMGLFLSKEEGYDPVALQWHKWGGVILSVFTLTWYYFRKQLQSVKMLPSFISFIALGIILVTGHQGAAITHGQNFLFAPVTPEKKKVLVQFEEAIVFADMVKPILQEKCLSCHNSKKAKGDLVMESEELLLKGGKNGKLWDTTATDFGLLLQRVHLPLEQKKHMPPQGKPQLTEEELEIIARWIKKGSDFALKVADLPANDTLRLIGLKTFMDAEMAQYDFEEADPSAIRKLNTVNRVVAQQSLNSPALAVSFFNAKLFSADQLKELTVIKKQIVSLDLSKMPVEDAELMQLSQFENLRRLHLNFTNINGAVFPELQKLKFLKILSLSGTRITARQLDQLKNFPQLKTVHVWNIPVDTLALRQIQSNAKNIRFETGFKGDTITLKLSPPLLQNEQQIITDAVSLKLKHYLPGVTIRYTTDNSEPDSIHSTIYKSGQMIDRNTVVRAKAYKPGWIGSDMMEVLFFKQTHKPDSIIFLTPPDSSYSGSAQLLTDLDKGSTNFRAGTYLAWRRKKMELLLKYNEPITVQSVTLSSVIDVYRYVMPPVDVEVWGGENPDQLKLLGRIVPEQPGAMKKDSLVRTVAFLKGFECAFKPTRVKYIKIIGTTVLKLPKWHTGKGDAGYIFVDEILVN